MHAPPIISSDPDQTKLLAKARGFAESLLGFIAGLEGLAAQFLIPDVPDVSDEPDTQARRRRRWPERDAKNSHRAQHTKSRPTAPRITFQHEQEMLIHIRRVEYTLRCFILWLVAQIIERAQETGIETFLSAHIPAQRKQYEETYGEGYIPPMIRQQDRELRDNLSDKVRLSSFSVTTPLILSGKRRTKTHSRYRLLPDQLREMDARFILARIERLGRALKRADVMAERLAVRALRASENLCDPHRPSGTSPFQGEETQGARSVLPLEKGEWSARTEGDQNTQAEEQELSPLRPAPDSAVHLPRLAVEESKTHTMGPSSTGLPGEVADRIYSGLTEGGATNPLYFQPFQNWLPPPDLYESGDKEEREVMNDLHFLASSGLKKLGFDPPKPISPLPDFSALKSPQPPQIRRL